jgi:hypothetical protein
MLLNKWDRCSQIDRYDETAIAIEKDTFMDRQPPVPQKVLFNVLMAVAGYADTEPYSASFAVSAFGKTKVVVKQTADGRQRQVEVPRKLTPLQSYGLEDPLVWVCDKAGELEMRQLTADVAGLRPWKVWHALSRRALKVRADVQRIRKRIPAHLPQAQTLKRLAGTTLAAFAKQTTFALVFFLAVTFGLLQWGVSAYDDWQYTRIYPALKAAETNAPPAEWAEKWKDAEAFLASYSKPSWFRLASHYWVLPPGVARQKLADLQPKFEEARRIVAVRDEFDIRVAGLVQQAQATQEVAQAGAKRRELELLAVPEEHPGGGPKKAEGLSRIDQRVEELLVAAAAEDLRRRYNDCMTTKELGRAAELLGTNERRPVAATLREDFQGRWYDLLASEAKGCCLNEQWDRARQEVDKVASSTEAMRLAGPNGRLRCDDLHARIDQYCQETVYRNWYTAKGNAYRYNEVLARGSQADRDAVMVWKKFDDFKEEPNSWEISIESVYQPSHGAIFSSQTETSCSRGGRIICTAPYTFDRTPETATFSSVKGTVSSVRYTETVSLSVYYTTKNWIESPAAGRTTWEGSMKDLLGGVSVKIGTNKAGDPEVKLRAKLSSGSIPSEPFLRSPKGSFF